MNVFTMLLALSTTHNNNSCIEMHLQNAQQTDSCNITPSPACWIGIHALILYCHISNPRYSRVYPHAALNKKEITDWRNHFIHFSFLIQFPIISSATPTSSINLNLYAYILSYEHLVPKLRWDIVKKWWCKSGRRNFENFYWLTITKRSRSSGV